jgi:hypothetical protein
MKQLRPEAPILILSDDPHLPEEELQTVDAIGTVSDEPPFFLPILQPFLNLEPVSLILDNEYSLQHEQLRHDQGSVLDDLKSIVDSFTPAAKCHVISEIHTVLAEFDRVA